MLEKIKINWHLTITPYQVELIFHVARLEDAGDLKKIQTNVTLISILYEGALGIATPKTNCKNNRRGWAGRLALSDTYLT